MPNRNTNAEFTVAQKLNKAKEQTAVNRLFLIFFLPFLYQDKKGNISFKTKKVRKKILIFRSRIKINIGANDKKIG